MTIQQRIALANLILNREVWSHFGEMASLVLNRAGFQAAAKAVAATREPADVWEVLGAGFFEADRCLREVVRTANRESVRRKNEHQRNSNLLSASRRGHA